MPSVPVETPFYLGTGAGAFLAVHHMPGHPRGAGVLICPPFGWEDVASYRARRAWAGQLAAAGYDVLRLDLPGTGDSAGGPRDPGRLAAWVAALGEAAGWLRAAGGERLTIIALGLGGLVTVRALQDGLRADALVLWGSPGRGRAAVRELRAFSALQAGAGETQPEAGVLEVSGFVLTEETLADLAAVEPQVPATAGVRRAMVLGRDGTPPAARLVDALREAGVDVETGPGDGYGAMVGHPQTSTLAPATAELVAGWLAAASPTTTATRRSAPDVATVLALTVDGREIRERPVSIPSPAGPLAGILTEPREEGRDVVAGLFLDAGAVRRIGPNRLWVETARSWGAAGVTSLRIDLQGVGDSGDGPGLREVAEFFGADLTAQAGAALAWLVAHRPARRAATVGLCSGGRWGFELAQQDARVGPLVCVNSGFMVWDRNIEAPYPPGPRHLLSAEGRAEQGARLATSLGAWAADAVVREATFRRSLRSIERGLDTLERHGARMVLALSQAEEDQFGLDRPRRLRRLTARPNVELVRLPGRDHTLRSLAAQRALADLLRGVIAEELAAGQPARRRPSSSS